MDYLPRIADTLLKDKLNAKGAVLIEGAKWCGKTTTARQIAKSVLMMQDPDHRKQYLQMADIMPSRLLEGDIPRLIDEWQIAPVLWDTVRFAVDQRNAFGQFILTGSAVPADLPKDSHSGTGRIARLMMRPMSLFESGDSDGSVSLSDLFQGKDISCTNETDLDQIAFLICRGGWPGALGLNEKAALVQAVDYLDGVVNSDISRIDNVQRDPQRTRNILRSYARHIGSQARITAIRDDVAANETDTFTEDTAASYINALKKIFVLEDSTAWNPNLRSRTAIRTTDTRYFTDPSIAAAALGLRPQDLINDLNTMGFFFENLCVRDLRIYAEAMNGMVYHYRDKSGRECDAVIHLPNGQYGLVEVKLGGEQGIAEGVENLLNFRDVLDIDKLKEPSFMMVLTGTPDFGYKTKGGIYIIPATCLRP